VTTPPPLEVHAADSKPWMLALKNPAFTLVLVFMAYLLSPFLVQSVCQICGGTFESRK
jgi:hypothetical protein